MSTLKAGERPPMPRVTLLPNKATATWLHQLSIYAPAVEVLILERPCALSELNPGTRDGVRNQLRRLRAQIDTALEQLT